MEHIGFSVIDHWWRRLFRGKKIYRPIALRRWKKWGNWKLRGNRRRQIKCGSLWASISWPWFCKNCWCWHNPSYWMRKIWNIYFCFASSVGLVPPGVFYVGWNILWLQVSPKAAAPVQQHEILSRLQDQPQAKRKRGRWKQCKKLEPKKRRKRGRW